MSKQAATRPGIAHFEIFPRNNKWDWVYYTANRRPLAASPKGYRRRTDAIKAINTIKERAAESEVLLAQLDGLSMPDDEEVTDNQENDTTPGDDAHDSEPDADGTEQED